MECGGSTQITFEEMGMTPLQKRCQELLPVIQAGAEGKAIECRQSGMPWGAKDPEFTVFWNDSDYRIKPEPKYRAFTPAEALLYEGRRFRLNDDTAVERRVAGASQHSVLYHYMSGIVPMLLSDFVAKCVWHNDGTPCGALIES